MNAVDISIPVRTRVCAVFDGKIDSSQGFGKRFDERGRYDGMRFTLKGRSNRAYYAHLTKIFDWIRPDTPVTKDQPLGLSGASASGSPHLHIALEKRDPTRFCKPGRLLDPCF